MAQIESKHDVRRKVRDAQAQVNRERLKRESDNRERHGGFFGRRTEAQRGRSVPSVGRARHPLPLGSFLTELSVRLPRRFGASPVGVVISLCPYVVWACSRVS